MFFWINKVQYLLKTEELFKNKYKVTYCIFTAGPRCQILLNV